ncbi:uncharacterized protein JCM6883_003076 [Sporobolomyces salmoneus]|uniref:uncharacterized protein n=1 Tax=Sporobolomyces salmoneus TaxID=183962 RepID=UPI003170E9A4
MQTEPIASTSSLSDPSRSIFPSTISIEPPRPRKSIIRLREDVWGSLAWPPPAPSHPEGVEMGSQAQSVEKEAVRMDEQLASTSAVDPNCTPSTPKTQQEEVEEDKKLASGSRLLSKSPVKVSAPRRRRHSSPRPSPHARPRSPPSDRPRPRAPSNKLSTVRYRSADSVPFLILPQMQSSLPSLKDYDDYLDFDFRIEPTRSFSFHGQQMEFFCRVADYRLWSKKPDSGGFNPPTFSTLSARLMNARLDCERIRRDFPRGVYDSKNDVPSSHPFWSALNTTLKWIYGRSVIRAESYWFVEHVPLNLLVLVRLHVDLTRYFVVVNHAFLDFRRYLVSYRFSDLSPPLQRARDLMEWLSPNGTRSARFDLWWTQEVIRERKGRQSLTEKWMNGEKGWETTEDLKRWEEENVENPSL